MQELQTAMELSPAEIDYVSGGDKDIGDAELDILNFRVLSGNKVRITNVLNHDKVIVPINVALAILGGAEVKSVEKKLGIK